MLKTFVLPLKSPGNKNFQYLFQQCRYIHSVLQWAKIHWKLPLEKCVFFFFFFFFCKFRSKSKWHKIKIGYFFFWNMVVISVHTHGVEYCWKIRWKSAFHGPPPPFGHQREWKYFGHFSVLSLQQTSIWNRQLHWSMRTNIKTGSGNHDMFIKRCIQLACNICLHIIFECSWVLFLLPLLRPLKMFRLYMIVCGTSGRSHCYYYELWHEFERVFNKAFVFTKIALRAK